MFQPVDSSGVRHLPNAFHFSHMTTIVVRRVLPLLLGTMAMLTAACVARSSNAVGATSPMRSSASGLAPTPPMGWNSWNKFQCNIDERLIRETTDAMVASGMRDAGYRYV